MKPIVIIALTSLFGCAVDGYGVRNHYDRGPLHDRGQFHVGCNENSDYHNSRPHNNPPPRLNPYRDDKRPPISDSFDSDTNSDSDSDSSSESGPDNQDRGPGDSRDGGEEDSRDEDWSVGAHRGWFYNKDRCRGWRCPHTTPPPWTRTPSRRRTTTAIPNWWSRPTERWQKTRPPTPRTTYNWFSTGTTGWSETTTRRSRPSRSTTSSPTTWSTIKSTTDNIPTTTSTPTTTINPQVLDDCITNCPSTKEYNPICGTDGETYQNIGSLLCAQQCGINVEVKRSSACGPPPPPPDDGSTSITLPTITAQPVVGRTISLTGFQRCMKQCLITYDYSPVCGSDLVTYINIDRMNCAKQCGQEVQVLCEVPCATCDLARTTSTLRPTTTSTTRSNLFQTLPTISMEQCIENCPVTPEYNPVCGNNNVTYTNPGHLLCAQLCGDDVKVVQLSPCPPVTTTPSSSESSDYEDYEETTYSPEITACIRRCPITSEYNPLCGTDDVTYMNPGRLECAQLCGANVTLLRRRPCFVPPDPDEITTTIRTTSISGNKDTVTTTLFPARTSPIIPSFTVTTPAITFSTNRSPFTSPTVTPSTVQTPSPTTYRAPITSFVTTSPTTTIDFTIPADILASIFGATSTQPTISPISNEDIDINPRFGNDRETKMYNTEFDTHKNIVNTTNKD